MGSLTPQTNSLRLFLQEELLRRCKKNPTYSARSFARTLGIENSALSKLLSGKRNISKLMAERLFKALDFTPEQIARYSTLIPNSHGSGSPKDLTLADNTTLATSNDRTEIFNQLTLDQFSLIADWYHYAILELIRVRNFQSRPRWIAKKLGITVSEVNVALERLMRLGYVERNRHGKIFLTTGPLSTLGNKFSATALRKLQKQILIMALDALEETPIEQRDQSSMTMAISTKKIPEAKEMIKKFRRQLNDFLEKDPTHLDAVYHLGISLYPVTKGDLG